MPRPLHWRSLSGGLVGLAAIVVTVFLVLVYARVGKLHGKIINLYVVASNAQGVVRGSEVWLAGQKVGVVKDISFQSSTVPRDARVLLHTHVLANATDRIRIDSHAQIQAGGTIIGAPVVYLRFGSAGSRIVRDGDTVHIDPPTDVSQTLTTAAIAAKQVPQILANIKSAAQNAHEAGTRFTGLTSGDGAAAHVIQVATQLRARLGTPTGSADRLLTNRDSLVNHVYHAMAAVDTVRALLATQTNAIGRFRRDSSLTLAVARVRDDLAEISQMSANATGNVHRLKADSSLFVSVESARNEMAGLLADMKAHPFRYIYVF